MGKSKSAMKRVRQSEKRRMRNAMVKTRVKTVSKKVLKEIDEGNAEEAKKRLKDTVSLLDKAVSKGVIHKNSAARKKSRLSKKVIDLSKRKTSEAA